MNLSPHFTLKEFSDSDQAERLVIDNSVPEKLIAEARRTANMMERIREYLSFLLGKPVPISVNSAHRCLALNRAIGSTDGSDHIKMMAIDFRAPVFGTPYDVSKALVPMMERLGIGQLIYEHTWVHVSSRPSEKIINRVLTVQGKNYAPGIIK